MDRRSALALLVVGATLAVPAPLAAQEALRTCVVAQADADPAGFAALVESEVDRHRTHQVARERCASHLKVELFEVRGRSYVTGRLGGEVPHRVAVEGDDAEALALAVSELLRVVLGNDPMVLSDPEGGSWFAGRLDALRKHGHNVFSIRLMETATPVDGHLQFAPGVGLAFAREIDHLELGIGALFAFDMSPATDRQELLSLARLEVRAAYYFSAEAPVSAFVAASLGIIHQRFRGPRPAELGGGTARFNDTLPGMGATAGVELLRTTNTRTALFAELLAPLAPTRDRQSEVISGWFPTMAAGVGVGF